MRILGRNSPQIRPQQGGQVWERLCEESGYLELPLHDGSVIILIVAGGAFVHIAIGGLGMGDRREVAESLRQVGVLFVASDLEGDKSEPDAGVEDGMELFLFVSSV